MSTWYAKSLQEYIEMIEMISDKHRDADRKYPLWFRGHERTDYCLEPGIYRNISNGKEKNEFNTEKTYGTLWLKEEYRYQHFVARNYDKVSSMPESLIEWQEVMQHYFSKTRLMDWSESAIVALSFALEAYIDPTEDHEVVYKRRNNSPVVWVLNPIKLNRKVYGCFRKKRLVERAMKQIDPAVMNEIAKEISSNDRWYFALVDEVNGGVNGLVSLSGLDSLRRSYGAELKNAVEDRNFNPFFYLLLRYYSDGLGIEAEELPPLAIIHPHHSSRIHEQKGAFTVFPYYMGKKPDEKNTSASPYAMEYMSLCRDCLEKIVLTNVYDTAEQLKEIGVRRSHLYPEMETVTKDFETIKY